MQASEKNNGKEESKKGQRPTLALHGVCALFPRPTDSGVGQKDKDGEKETQKLLE